MGVTVWRSRVARVLCGSVVAVASVGVLFTLTRAVWIAAVVGPVCALLLVPRLRRLIVPLLGGLLVTALAAFLLVPGLGTKADSRLNDKVPVWDRYNTDATALRMVEMRPLFGFGWQTFHTLGSHYVRQADGYPITSASNEVHNVFLSHAAELGIVGSVLWTLALFSAVGGAIVRRGPPELLPWRLGLVAVFVAYLVVASFGPLSYPFPNALLWTWAGVAGAPFFLRPPERLRVRRLPERSNADPAA
jgi:O-antigen ligase